MSAVRFERPTPESIRFIADNMRPEDAEEVMAMNHYTPFEAMSLSVKNSAFAVVVVIDDIPVTMLGLVIGSAVTGMGSPWLLSARQALNHRRKFIELAPDIVDEMLQICPKLVNYVHVKNRLSIRWLKRIGFIVEAPVPIGVNGEMFHRFSKEV